MFLTRNYLYKENQSEKNIVIKMLFIILLLFIIIITYYIIYISNKAYNYTDNTVVINNNIKFNNIYLIILKDINNIYYYNTNINNIKNSLNNYIFIDEIEFSYFNNKLEFIVKKPDIVDIEIYLNFNINSYNKYFNIDISNYSKININNIEFNNYFINNDLFITQNDLISINDNRLIFDINDIFLTTKNINNIMPNSTVPLIIDNKYNIINTGSNKFPKITINNIYSQISILYYNKNYVIEFNDIFSSYILILIPIYYIYSYIKDIYFTYII